MRFSVGLGGQFYETWEALGGKRKLGQPVYESLKKLYEPRAYHNLTHIRRGLHYIDVIAKGEGYASDRLPLLRYGMWFHDAKDDVPGSLQLALNAARNGGFLTKEFSEQLRDIIEATAHDVKPRTLGAGIVADADLAILAAGTHVFDDYNRSIRKEYEHVSDQDYRVGRLDVLAKFHKRNRIYTTQTAYEMWELKAKRNLELAIRTLLK